MSWSKNSSDKEMVIKIQRRLNEWGFGPISVDGMFGGITEKGLIDFQKYNNLKGDGVVGDKTYPILFPEESITSIEKVYENNKEMYDSDYRGYTQEEIQLIIDYEVGGGRAYYDRFLRKPTWPGYESGLTIMIGVDLRFISDSDFKNLPVSNSVRNRLAEFVGKSPAYAKANVGKVKDIEIDWNTAYNYFKNVTLSKWENNTRRAFNGFDSLPSCVRIALISLVFNRGASMSGNRRIEMKNIRDYFIPRKDYKGIADQIRQMTRLWKGSDIEKGMQKRRYAEAAMVERALV